MESARPHPTALAARHLGGQISAAPELPPAPTHIVKYTSRANPGCERGCFGIDEATDFAIGLVRDGEAHPDTISIYAITTIAVRVMADHQGEAPARKVV